MTDIIPAILPASFEELEDALARVRGITREVQLDVVDGRYASNVTWPLDSANSCAQFARMVSQEEGLPSWEDFDFEVDLMLKDPVSAAHDWAAAGASRVIIHADSARAPEAARASHTEGLVRIGIALKSDDSIEALAPFEGLYDYVQVMGIEKVGFQGQPFDERALVLIRQLRAQYPELTIQVDGGVKRENARALAEAGANRLVAGSSIVKSDDPRRAIDALQASLQFTDDSQQKD